MPGPIRVGVVDDHPSIVAAIAAALDVSHDLISAGTGRTLDRALALLPTVDVLICDVQLAGGAEGLEVLDAATRMPSGPAVVLLTGHGHPSVLRAAVERGAAGYLDKGMDVDAILGAVRTVAAGGTAFRSADLAAVRAAPRLPTDRERQVLDAVVGGATNGEIAARLGLSEKTVETHLHRMFDRYGVLSRTELAVLAVSEGWTRRTSGGTG